MPPATWAVAVALTGAVILLGAGAAAYFWRPPQPAPAVESAPTPKADLGAEIDAELAKFASFQALKAEYPADYERIAAAVGPCIAQVSYEVGLEFLDRFLAVDPANERFFTAGVSAEKRQFDLPGFVLSRIESTGVETCAWIGADTCADEARFYSNRRAFQRGEPDFGRLLSAITLV